LPRPRQGPSRPRLIRSRRPWLICAFRVSARPWRHARRFSLGRFDQALGALRLSKHSVRRIASQNVHHPCRDSPLPAHCSSASPSERAEARCNLRWSSGPTRLVRRLAALRELGPETQTIADRNVGVAAPRPARCSALHFFFPAADSNRASWFSWICCASVRISGSTVTSAMSEIVLRLAEFIGVTQRHADRPLFQVCHLIPLHLREHDASQARPCPCHAIASR